MTPAGLRPVTRDRQAFLFLFTQKRSSKIVRSEKCAVDHPLRKNRAFASIEAVIETPRYGIQDGKSARDAALEPLP